MLGSKLFDIPSYVPNLAKVSHSVSELRTWTLGVGGHKNVDGRTYRQTEVGTDKRTENRIPISSHA